MPAHDPSAMAFEGDQRRAFGSTIAGAEPGRAVIVPGHSIVRQIGSGSYGQVWLAISALGAFRAVKTVFRTPENPRVFERELHGIRTFEPYSKLHTGLVAILEVGLAEDGTYFYYVMELADDVIP